MASGLSCCRLDAREPPPDIAEFGFIGLAGGVELRMLSASTPDPVLRDFKSALIELYGDRLDTVVLFGSRARGHALDGSDYDVAVFLRDLPDAWAERRRLADLRVDFLDRTGAFFDAKPYSIAAYSSRTPLMHDIRAHGRVV